MRLPFTIDGVDFSAVINKYGYSVRPVRREGSNGGMMQDGSRRVDLLDYKAGVSVASNDMDPADAARLNSALRKEYVWVTYWDPTVNAVRTAEFIPDISASEIAAVVKGVVQWIRPVAIYLEER